MKRIRLGILLVSLLCLFAACGSDSHDRSITGNAGAVTFSLSWNSSSSSPKALMALPPGADVCAYYQIETINASVINSSNQTVATGSWPCSAHSGTIPNVPAGVMIVSVEGVVSGIAVWRGEVTDVAVVAGQTAAAGAITMSYVGADMTSPLVLNMSPASAARNVALGIAAITVTFDDDMVVASVNSSTFIVTQGITTVTGTVHYEPSSRTATFTPAAALLPATTYSVTITTGVENLAGKKMGGNYTGTFTTAYIAWIAEGTSVVKVSSANEELQRIDTFNCKSLSGLSQFARDEKNGRLWITDTNNYRVIAVDERTGLLAVIDQTAPEVEGAAIDPRNGSFWSSTYVSAAANSKLIKRNSIGLISLETQTGLFVSMMDNSMSWNSVDNSLWFADYGNYVYKLWGTDAQLAGYNLNRPSSTNHLRIGPLGQAFELSCYPKGTGHVWVADRNTALIKYGLNGTEMLRIPVSNMPGFYGVYYVSTDISDGSVWVGGPGAGNGRIAKYSSGGTSLFNGASDMNTLEADPLDSGVWVGTNTGLTKLAANGAQQWNRSSSGVRSIVLQTQPPSSKTIYVGKNGNDSTGDGSVGNSYLTIGKAMTVVADGDTISIGTGTYHENISLKSGITLLGAGFGVTAILGLGTSHVIDGAAVQNATIEGFTITGAGNTYGGVYCANCDGLIIRGCRIVNNGNSSTSNGILLGGTTNALIERNIISGNATCGIDVQGYAVIRNNIITNNKDSGIYGGSPAPLTTYIVNNVIDSNGSVSGGRSGIMAFNSIVIKNNIISNNGYSNPNPGLSVGIYVGSGSSVALSYNNVYNNYQGTYTGITAGTGDINANPLYVNSASGDYHLQAGSPSINTGDPTLHDAGVSCLSYPNTRSDMGAYGGPWGNW